MKRMTKSLRIFLALAAVTSWFLFLRPVSLGGDTTYAYVQGISMEPTYHTADLVVLHQRDSYKVGDVVAFQVGDLKIIHRLVSGNNVDGWKTQGDNNPTTDGVVVTNDAIYGSATYMIPQGGKFVSFARSPYGWFAVSALFVLAAFRSGRGKDSDRQRDDDDVVIDLRDSSLASSDSESTRV